MKSLKQKGFFPVFPPKSFRERVAGAGIAVPIEAGIMPAVNKKQIERIVTLCGVNLPKKFLAIMERYEEKTTLLV